LTEQLAVNSTAVDSTVVETPSVVEMPTVVGMPSVVLTVVVAVVSTVATVVGMPSVVLTVVVVAVSTAEGSIVVPTVVLTAAESMVGLWIETGVDQIAQMSAAVPVQTQTKQSLGKQEGLAVVLVEKRERPE